ncbi:MAG: hypothetical protein ACKV19_09155 [Verrucomicrobiales bacterium]
MSGIFIVASTTLAQLPTARLDGVTPRGGQVGRGCEIVLQGTDLDDVRTLIFSHPGLTATHIEGARFAVTMADSVPVGAHEVRAVGHYGISTPAVFAIGSLPEIAEPPDNRTAASAAPLTPPTTVNATAEAEVADFFTITLRQGQSLHLDCAAQRIDSPLNAVISVRNPAGIEVHRAQRTLDRDPVTHFTAATDGAHTIEIHDATWRGGPNFVYRLTASVDQTVPTALPPPRPLAGAITSPQTAEVVAEVEPNDTASAAQSFACPGEIDGRLDRDWFAFTASTSGPVVVEVFSHRLGVPSDPVAVVHAVTRETDGAERLQQVAEFDDVPGPPGTERFRLGTRDPAGSLPTEAGTTYRIFVIDRFNSGGSYRLAVRAPKPDFHVLVLPESPVNDGKSLMRWTPVLRPGSATALAVAVVRLDGFNEPVTIEAANLPAGVSMAPCLVPADRSAGLIVLHAAVDAAAWSGPLDWRAHAGDQRRTVREVTPRWSVGDSGTERVDLRLAVAGPMLAVSKDADAPMRIDPVGEPTIETSLGATVQLPVKFVRAASHKGFKGEWEVALTGLPGQQAWQPAKPAGDAAEATISLALTRKDGNQFLPGTWTAYAAARGTVQWQPDDKTPAREVRDTTFSPPIRMTIEPSPIRLSAPDSIMVARGGKTMLPVTLQRRFGFAEGIEVRLKTPDSAKGLSAATVTVPKDAAEAVLTLEAAADAAPGRHLCTIESVCRWNDEELVTRQNLTVDVSP